MNKNHTFAFFIIMFSIFLIAIGFYLYAKTDNIFYIVLASWTYFMTQVAVYISLRAWSSQQKLLLDYMRRDSAASRYRAY